MTDEKTIGELDAVVSLLSTALIEIEQGAASFNATIQQVLDLVPPTGLVSLNGDTTGAQIIAAGTGLGIVDAGATHTLAIDATVATLTGVQTFTNKIVNSFTNEIAADEVHVQIRNESGGTINRGDAVFISGYSVGQDLPLVQLADASGVATMEVFGIVADSSIANNANGDVLILGRISGFDTSSFSVGDELFVSNVGTTGNTLTSTRPTGTDLIQAIGEVLRSNATLGVLEVIIAHEADLPNVAIHDLSMGGLNLTSVVIVTPTIASFVNATHDHEDAAGGGQLDSTLALSDTADIAYLNTDNTFLTNTKQTFTHQSSKAGIALAAVAGDVSAPNNGEYWYNSTSNKFRARENGVTVDMIGGGGSQTPWTSNIDADGFDLQDLSNIEFRETTGAPLGTVPSIYHEATGITLNVPASDTFSIDVNAIVQYTFNATTLDMNGNSIDNALFYAINGTVANDGQFRLGNAMSIRWRNQANDENNLIRMNNDVFEIGFDNVIQYDFSATEFIIGDANNIVLNTTTGTKFGTGATQKIGFWNATPVVQPTGAGADLTNNVTTGGTNNTIADYSDLSTYANDAAAIRNDIFQLARSLKFLQDSLRLMGLQS